MAKQTVEIQISQKELAEIIRAYNRIGDFLETIVSKEALYKKHFTDGLDGALEEVRQKKTKQVNTFDEFIA